MNKKQESISEISSVEYSKVLYNIYHDYTSLLITSLNNKDNKDNITAKLINIVNTIDTIYHSINNFKDTMTTHNDINIYKNKCENLMLLIIHFTSIKKVLESSNRATLINDWSKCKHELKFNCNHDTKKSENIQQGGGKVENMSEDNDEIPNMNDNLLSTFDGGKHNNNNEVNENNKFIQELKDGEGEFDGGAKKRRSKAAAKAPGSKKKGSRGSKKKRRTPKVS